MKKINLSTPIILVLEENYIHKTICKHLMNQGICSVKELCMLNMESLQGFKGIKDKSIATIKSVIAEYGLHLGMDENELAEYAKDMPSFQFPKKANNLPKIDWEQRRYEITKSVYTALIKETLTKVIPTDETAHASVMYADCLVLQLQINQLERKRR